MSRVSISPFPVATGGLTLSCVGSNEGVVHEEEGLLSAEDAEASSVLKLSVLVQYEDGLIESVLPETDRGKPPIEVLVLMEGISTRQRRAFRLEKTGDGWRGDVVVSKDELFGEVGLRPVMVRNTAGSDPAFAVQKGQLLADGERLILQVDETPRRAGGTLQFHFESFSSPSAPSFCQRDSAQLFALDLTESTPAVWFNTDVPDLEGTVKSKAKTGVPRMITDASMAMVGVEVWTALCLVAFSSLEEALSEGNEGEGALHTLEHWEKSVVWSWAKKLFPGKTTAGAYDEVCGFLRDNRLPELVGKLSLAVQKEARSREAFDRLQEQRLGG